MVLCALLDGGASGHARDETTRQCYMHKRRDEDGLAMSDVSGIMCLI